MTIATILRTKGDEVVSVAPDADLAEVVARLAERRIGAMPVMAGGRVVGVISERDVLRRLAAVGAVALGERVDAAMTAPAISVAPDMAILTALSLMTDRRVRHLPVEREGRVVGVVSIGDLVKARIDRIEHEAAAMRDYIAG